MAWPRDSTPGADVDELLAEAERCVRGATAPHAIAWQVALASPPFQTRDLASFRTLLGDRASSSDAVDLGFWTEAARFAERGIDAVVFGPGAVEQAHAADEHVEIAELEAARLAFAAVLA